MTIYLEPNEEITSVVDHLIQAKEKEVVLVVPIGAQILQSLINLRLLKREADTLSKKIILVTQDEYGQKLAKKAEIETYASKDKINFFMDKLTPTTAPAKPAEEPIQQLSGDIDNLAERDVLPTDEPKMDTLLVVNRPVNKIFPAKQEKGSLRVIDIIGPDAISQKSSSRQFFPLAPKKTIEEDFEKKIKESLKRRNSVVVESVAWQDVFSGFYQRISSWLSRFSRFNFIIITVILAVTTLYIILFWVLPRASVYIQPKTEDIALEQSITVDKNISQIDFSANKVSGQVIKLEQNINREFPSTGERQLNEKAHGVITIYNEYSSSPQTLVGSTRFISEAGKIFRLPKTIVVPGARIEEGKIVASSMETEVIADEPGDAYNIGPGRFSIPGLQGTPKYNAFFAKSSQSMAGGIVGKARIVSQADVDKAKEIVGQDIHDRIYAQMKGEIPADFKLLDEAISKKIMPWSVIPEIGVKGDSFVLTTKVSLDGIIFNENNLKSIIVAKMRSQLSQNKELIDKSLSIDYKKVSTDFGSGTTNLTVIAHAKDKLKIEIAPLKEKLRGQDEKMLKGVLANLPEINSMKVNFWPFWVKRIPNNLNKIEVKISDI